MRILFLHQNFPGQFLSVADALAAEGRHQLVVVTDAGNQRPDVLPTVRYRFERDKLPVVPRTARPFLAATARGEVVHGAMRHLKERGFEPDLVIGHLGWGETLYVRDVWPKTKVLIHAEFYYSTEGADVGFDLEFDTPTTPVDTRVVRARNAAILLAMDEADRAIAPTRWQASRFPESLAPKIVVQHEGIRTDVVKPNPNASFTVPGTSLTFRPGDEALTFVNRNLEPYRGYHTFMRALPDILAARPDAHALIVGGDGVSYGSAAPQGQTWKEIFLAQVRDRLPMERVHFLGRVPYDQFVALMQVSAAHVYLTYPFVLSWSLMEAMSAGAPIVASRTKPVEEMIEDGRTGLLFDFFDAGALAARTIDVLAAPERHRAMRDAARAHIVANYDLKTRCLPGWLDVVRATAAGR